MATDRRNFRDTRAPQIRVNHRIRVPEVRVVLEDGGMLGVMSTQQALREAEERGLDLVEVNPKAAPPVCKILDFGKFKYEEKKRARGETQADRRRGEGEQAPAEDRRPRPRREAPGRTAVHRVGQQGEVHVALPRPRDRPSAARADAARLAP